MIAAGDVPGRGRADRSAPRRTPGRRRAAPARRRGRGRPTPAPTRVSALHRLGLRRRRRRSARWPRSPRRCSTSSGPVDESLPLVLAGRAPWRSRRSRRAAASLSLRAIPLTRGGPAHRRARAGARRLASCAGASASCSPRTRRSARSTTGSRTTCRRWRRCCGCRPAGSAPRRGRAALREAVRRVGVDRAGARDAVAGASTRRSTSTTSPTGGSRWPSRSPGGRRGCACSATGRSASCAAEDATPLALVLTELVQNAVEHGLDGGGGGDASSSGRARREAPGGAVSRRRGAACRRGSPWRATASAPQIVQALVARAARQDQLAAATERRHAVVGGGDAAYAAAPPGPGELRRAVTARSGPASNDGPSAMPRSGSSPAAVAAWAVPQPARRARALRRLSARRSSSDNPPQTPAS